MPAPADHGASPPRLDRRVWLAIVLLTPGIPELLTGSTSISRVLFDPFGFLVNLLLDVALYTSGALLIREAAIRWRKGWGTILLLGLAYGIVEEGLAVHTYFQTGGNPVDGFGSFGRLLGLNWVWATEFAFFHATFSIALPLYLFGRLYPELRDTPLLTRARALTCATGILAVILVGDFAFAASDRPPLAWELGLGSAVALLLLAARALPAEFAALVPGDPTASPRRFLLVGLLPFLAWIPGAYLLMGARVPALAVILFLVVTNVGVGRYVLRHLGTHHHEAESFAFVVGLLLPILGWSILLGILLVPGLEFVGIGYLLFLLWMRRHRFPDDRSAMTPPPGASGPVLPSPERVPG